MQTGAQAQEGPQTSQTYHSHLHIDPKMMAKSVNRLEEFVMQNSCNTSYQLKCILKEAVKHNSKLQYLEFRNRIFELYPELVRQAKVRIGRVVISDSDVERESGLKKSKEAAGQEDSGFSSSGNKAGQAGPSQTEQS